MEKKTRRQFIQQTTAGVAGMAALNLKGMVRAAEPAGTSAAFRNQGPLLVPGVHAYTMEKSVQAGQTIDFCVSSTLPYTASIHRLGAAIDDPKADFLIQDLGQFPSNPQPIYPGSYVIVDEPLPPELPALTLECWVRPWKTDAWAGLISQYEYPSRCGYGLFLNPNGGVTVYMGDGGQFKPELNHESEPNLLKPGQWHHLVGTFDGLVINLWLDGAKVGHWKFFPNHPPVLSRGIPMRLAAYGQDIHAAHFLDGDLAMPVVYRRALTEDEIWARFNQRGLKPAEGRDVLASWTLAEEKGDHIKDSSNYKRHGKIINHATWMVAGPSFKADVSRYGNYNPNQDPDRGHGLRFASDDLYDCQWSITHSVKIPPEARPGIYVGRFQYEKDGETFLYHTTFIVRKARKSKPAPLLVLCSTNTWLAYNGTPFGVNSPELMQVFGTAGGENSPGQPPAFNFYHGHRAGQGTYQVGLRVPWPAAGPYVLYGGPTQYSHLMRAERFAQTWLEQAGYRFDVATDLDFHRDPDQLRQYQAVLINGHSEYWSVPMYQGLERYLANRGNVVCLSGNSLFWRVTFNEEGTVLECRKVDAPGDQLPGQRRGECWHSHDGQRGGLMRECGFPGWKLVGLETLGWNNQSNPDQFGPYLVDRPDHMLFHHPIKIDLAAGDPIGQAPDGGLPRANGHEIDVRPSTLKALQIEPPPAGGVVPDDPPGMIRLANGVIPWKQGGAAFDFFLRGVKPDADQGAEMIYWERPEGGRVFNAGSIASGWALHADPNFQRLIVNVLAHFGVTTSGGLVG